MFAIAETHAQSEIIAQAMLRASCDMGIAAQGQATEADVIGARVIGAHETIKPMPVVLP